MTTKEQTTSAATRRHAAELLEHCQIIDVRPTRIVAEIAGEQPLPITSVNFEPTIQYTVDRGVFRNRISYTFEFGHESGELVASMEFALVVEWSVPEDYTPEKDAAEFVSASTGYFAAFPYARELAQSTTARLGLDPVVLGILNRKELKPQGITVNVRPSSGHLGLSPNEQATMESTTEES